MADQYVVSFDGVLHQLPATTGWCPAAAAAAAVVLAQDHAQSPAFTLLLLLPPPSPRPPSHHSLLLALNGSVLSVHPDGQVGPRGARDDDRTED